MEKVTYPILPQLHEESHGKVLINADHLENQFRETIYRERTNEIRTLRYKAEEKIKHLQKVKDRWTKANSTIKYVGFSMILVTGTAATVLASFATAGFAIPAIVVLSVSGAGLVHTSIVEALVNKLTGRKKKEYRDRIKTVKSYLDKMYILFEKARSDQDISNDELEAIRNLSKQMENTQYEEVSFEFFEKKIQELNSMLQNSGRPIDQKPNKNSNTPSAPSGSKLSLFT